MLTRSFSGLLLLLTALPASAIEIRSYSAIQHDRFVDFPSSPAKNPDQDFAHLDLTGIGWFVSSPDIQFALVSRQHVLFASHFQQIVSPSNPIRFLSGDGTEITRTAPTKVILQDGGMATDITVLTLSSPIDAGDGVSPLSFLPIDDPSLQVGLAIAVAGKNPSQTTGKFPTIARGVIAELPEAQVELDVGGNGTVDYASDGFRFDYLVAAGDPDECYFFPQGGDSGSPSLVDHGGTAALLGLHSKLEGIGAPGFPQTVIRWENYDALIPAYIAEIDAVLNPTGYRMRPVDAPTTTLSTAVGTVETTPRKGKPLGLSFDITNSGANLTGNLEVEFHFDPGAEPDSVSAPGWVTYGSGSKWTLRKATLGASESGALLAYWAAAPSVDSLEPTLVWRSDTVDDESASPAISLAPSFTDWASGLAEGEQEDDPDHDGLVNLLEYALGGDPESGVTVFEDGGPLQPQLLRSGNQLVFSYPERIDKTIRGLSYELEFSDDLKTWDAPEPADLVSGSAPYDPNVDGFVKATHAWTPGPLRQFVRLRVNLNE